MKPLGKTFLALLLCLSVVACTSLDHTNLQPLEHRGESAGVTVNRTGHPVILPLETLANATFVGSNGELIMYADQKGLYATVITPEDWGNPPIQMNTAPKLIFERDTDSIQNDAFREELQGIIRLTLEPVGQKDLKILQVGETTAYIAFNPEKTIIMLTSPDKPDLFSQLVLNNFSWEEIEMEILKGIKGN